ncbi:hypothetical protein DSM104443_00988 [Usitatibacter rugosus]|uniref:Uncharacterized protein n=1 Tax=Usitatibacter rugosus TaxID=2732067 RepID=A0A6M4GWD3_9PROT|nr:hypothetical protein [Usitatibacter rugosus]QJR09937.1 hypothetical protein DSM104443_00988 [Usitatibacter rugosus]
MRQQRPTTLILAVSLALFANAALAQRATTGGGARVGGGTAAVAAPGAAANAATNANASTSANASTNANTGTQGSSTGIVANTSGGNQVVFGVPANGTQGSNTGNGTNPQPNLTQGQTTGTSNGTTTGTSNGSTTGTSNGSTSPGVVPSGVANLQARLFDSNGNMLTDANGRALLTDGVSVIGVGPAGVGFDGATIGVDPSQVVVANAMLAPTTVTGTTAITPELDRATRKELSKARQASRSNKQLLTSIAPRTNVDRTDQMADDPLPVRY